MTGDDSFTLEDIDRDRGVSFTLGDIDRNKVVSFTLGDIDHDRVSLLYVVTETVTGCFYYTWGHRQRQGHLFYIFVEIDYDRVSLLHLGHSRLFCVALVFFLFERLGDEYFRWWYT